MRILTRYMLKAHIGPFLFALFALTGILFVNVIAQRVGEMAGKGLGLAIILEVLWLSLPHVLALTLPMAVLVSVLYAFAQMAADNEITALKASGTNLVRMIMPLLVVAFLFAGFMVWFNDRLLPDSNHQLKRIMAAVTAKTPTLQLREQTINEIRTGDFTARYWLKAGRIDNSSRKLWDVVIYDMSSGNARKARTIYADSGTMAMNAAETDLMMTLRDGFIHEVDEREPGEFQRQQFAELQVELQGVGTQLQRSVDEYRSDREMSVAMMSAMIDTARAELAQLRTEAAATHQMNLARVLAGPGEAPIPDAGDIRMRGELDMQFGRRPVIQAGGDDVAYEAALQAQRLANSAATLQTRINMYQVEIHKKYAIPVASIIFVLLGAPLAIRFPRGGVGMVIAASIGIFAIYYMSLIGGEELGDRGQIQPFWGPWAPNVLFGLIALWALARIGRETATSRGGGFDDVWLSLRRILTPRAAGR